MNFLTSMKVLGNNQQEITFTIVNTIWPLDPAGNKSVNIVNYKLGKCARHFPNLFYKLL